ncbi:MAG: mechanosensitive ion channel family protein [Planctomycetes bacterium]|nr:mechanosensitive ion channel family protein [Planctomycetota bacterium]
MKSPETRLIIATVTLLALWTGVCTGQETQPAGVSAATEEQATSQPTTTRPTTAPAENSLASPARMIRYFDAQVEAGQIEAALTCLSFKSVDPQVRHERGPDYVRMLSEILRRLEQEEKADLAKLSDEPTAPSQTIGKDPLLLVLEREADLRWRFSASTVVSVPDLHERLAELDRPEELPVQPPVPPPTPQETPEINRLRSPYHMMEFFLVKVADAKRDTANYVDAMTCLDFSDWDVREVETRGPDYVDNLAAILARLREDGQLDRETLDKEPDADLDTVAFSSEQLQVVLVKQADECWRFSAATVKRVPEMMAALEARAEEEAGAGQPVASALPPALQLDTTSPQATMNLFLTAMGDQDLAMAVSCLDLSRLTENERELAQVLAGKLLMVLNRDKVIVLQDVDSNPERAQPFTFLKHTAGRIEIGRETTGGRAGEWLFTAATVASIERLYEAFESQPVLPEFANDRVPFRILPSLYVREYLVPTTLKRPSFGLQLWQWLGLAAVLVVGLLIRGVCGLLLPFMVRRALRNERVEMLPGLLRKALVPALTLAMVATWWGGLQFLDLGAAIMSRVWWALRIIMTVVAVFAAYRLIDVVTAYFSARAVRTSSRLDDVLVPLLQKTLKVAVVALGAVFIAKMFGFQVSALLAGLGLGGLAFGLAAQDTLKNFFGSVNVVLDRPFQVGDWVKIGGTEGTVESVGVRSSRIRTFYNSQVTVPNSEIMNSLVDNLGRRQYRRISCMLSVAYSTTPVQLEAFCEGIRELIRRHPYTRKDYFHAWVNKFAASSIDILLYCFHETPDWATELRERHRLFLDIIRLAKRLGVEFAFPTQTIHLEGGEKPLSVTRAVPGEAALPAESLPPTAVPAEPEYAVAFGKDEAARIVGEFQGDLEEKPPPVKF